MRSLSLVPLLLTATALPVAAQTKLSGTFVCTAKPEVNAVAQVGDAPGHRMSLWRSPCTWSKPFEVAGLKPISALEVGVAEVHGAAGAAHGYSTTPMDNGDTAVVRWQGTSRSSKGEPFTQSGTWSFVRGTGKLAGLTGGGRFTGRADSVMVEGEYRLPAKTALARKKP